MSAHCPQPTEPKPRKRAELKPRNLAAFWREEEGSYAIEFALVATPFLALVLAILELGLVFLAGTHLEKAVDEASRTILTGTAQASGFDAAAFRNEIITASAGALFTASELKVDVRPQTSFSTIDTTLPVNADGEVDDTQFLFDAGSCNEIVLVRVYYNWPIIAPKFGIQNLGLDLSSNTKGIHILSSIKAFQNEPFC